MAIVPHPKRHRIDSESRPREEAVREFVNGADDEAPAAVSVRDRDKKVVTTIRIDPDLLRRADADALAKGISRGAWISLAMSKALKPKRD